MTKTFWGGIVAACAGLLGIFGIDVSADSQTAIINGLSAGAVVCGSIVSAVSAWKNRKKGGGE